MWSRPKVQYSDGGRTVVLRPLGPGGFLFPFWRRFRFLVLNLAFLVLVAAVFIYGIWARADVWKFYPSTCLGNWENVDNSLGRPDLGEGSSYLEFTPGNSSRLTGPGSQIFCANFRSENDLDFSNKRIAQARLTLSLAYVPPTPSSAIEEAVGDLRETLEEVSESASTTPEESPTSSAETSSETPVDAPVESPPAESPRENSPAPVETAPPAETPPPAEAPTSWFRWFIPVFAQTTTTLEGDPGTTPEGEPTSTLEVPIDPGSDSLEITEPPPAEQILTDLLEVSYSVDGKDWNVVSDIIAKDAERVTFTLPLSSWDEIPNLQISLRALLAGGEIPSVYLDGMELEVIPEDTPAEETPPAIEELPAEETTSAVPATPSDYVEFDVLAKHSCSVEPFLVELKRGESADLALNLSPSEGFASSSPGVKLGPPPSGVDARLQFENGQYGIRISSLRRALPGSYSLTVIYWQEGEEPRSNTFCQYNLILN